MKVRKVYCVSGQFLIPYSVTTIMQKSIELSAIHDFYVLLLFCNCEIFANAFGFADCFVIRPSVIARSRICLNTLGMTHIITTRKDGHV